MAEDIQPRLEKDEEVMGTLSQHWTFWERLKWMLFGDSPSRDVLRSELERLRRESVESDLEMIDKQYLQQARLEKIKYLEHEVER